MANSLQGKWQSGRQASDGKWQERNGRAKWQRHGNKSATGSTCSNNATLAAQHTAHCTKKWPTMRAAQKAQWWLNTRLAAVAVPPCPASLLLHSLLLLLPASCCCCIVRLQWPNASGSGGVASIGALMPGDRREKLPAKWVCV